MTDKAAIAPSLFDAALEQRRTTKRQFVVIGLIVAAAAFWSAWGTDFNIPKLMFGMPAMYDLGTRMMPPDLSIVPDLMNPLIETLQMALLGTTIPIFIALPLAFLAAVNTSPNLIVSAVVRVLLGALRTVPELIWAMILVTAVGLGPFPGVIALTLHSIGGLGKFYYEAIEASDKGIIEAMTCKWFEPREGNPLRNFAERHSCNDVQHALLLGIQQQGINGAGIGGCWRNWAGFDPCAT